MYQQINGANKPNAKQNGRGRAAPAPLQNGQHPTNRELQLMRLGYPEYQQRLSSIQQHNPARYNAIMDKQKLFTSGDFRCVKCGGVEQYTRNLACRGCCIKRSKAVFVLLESPYILNPEYRYIPDEVASERYQERVQAKQYLDWFRGELMLVRVQCGQWLLERGVLFQPGKGGRSQGVQYLQPNQKRHAEFMNNPEYREILNYIENTIGERP
ncbi:hypothetical protein OGV36_18590 [Citrobacter sp. Cb008]|uniref:hypothetical protein n=2 Tax=Enterobacterales TaxID=91347 RepID=UPI001BE4827F|nr:MULTISPECIES: hypothetical protein [Enterobacteriaceae]MDM3365381.1 hypothetical protein [Citrobacter sp. Cb005]MDM3372358.1 hypothetical protein [Citrobacter sp. Cb008]MDT7127755.1 hypothetical protein [Citrobacter braakii]